MLHEGGEQEEEEEFIEGDDVVDSMQSPRGERKHAAYRHAVRERSPSLGGGTFQARKQGPHPLVRDAVAAVP